MYRLCKERLFKLAFIVLFTLLASQVSSKQPNAIPSTLYAALDYYGFKSNEQKEALRFLMKRSGIQNTDQLLDEKTNHKKIKFRKN